MAEDSDRRRTARHFGHNLVVLIDGRAYPILDISPDGIRFQGTVLTEGAIVSVDISSLGGTADDCITVKCRVVEVTENATRAVFSGVTMQILHYIIRHMGEVLGVEPYYFTDEGTK